MMTVVAPVTEEAVELACVLIPLPERPLLLPSVCIAEILPWRHLAPVPGGPDWAAGTLDWRGERLPVLRVERLAGSDMSPVPGRSLVVLNRSRADAPLPFYAVAAAGLPRLVQMTEDDLGDAAPAAPAGGLAVQLGAEPVWIADLRLLEARAAELLTY